VSQNVIEVRVVVVTIEEQAAQGLRGLVEDDY